MIYTIFHQIRFMIYTPEKVIISMAGPGDLYIFDELPNDPDAEVK